LRGFLSNPFCIGYVLIYTASVILLADAGFGPAEPLVVLVIFGLLLPGVTFLITRNYVALAARVDAPAGESKLLLAYLLVIVLFLTAGLWAIDAAVPDDHANYFTKLAGKLVFFVAIPFAIFARRGYRWRDFMSFGIGRHGWVIAIVLSLLFIGVNAVIGKGLQRIDASAYSLAMLLSGGVLVYLVLMAEVGLVEEYLFRGLLQQRLSAWFGNPVSGLFLAALLFGLAHAPGYYLRWQQTAADLFNEPSLLFALAYSVAVISVTGLFMGVLWWRTRSLLIVMMVHAAGDWLPNVSEMLATFGF
jgi:membrane protease YdiL (CAAX protease family)